MRTKAEILKETGGDQVIKALSSTTGSSGLSVEDLSRAAILLIGAAAVEVLCDIRDSLQPTIVGRAEAVVLGRQAGVHHVDDVIAENTRLRTAISEAIAILLDPSSADPRAGSVLELLRGALG